MAIDRYFACCDCKIYLNAGDRWAYWTLEDIGTVNKGAPISVKAVLSAGEYWNPEKDEETNWLYREIFPSVRLFLKEHESHKIIFGDADDFLYGDAENYYQHYFDWLRVGYCARESVRSFVDELGFKTWDEVRDYISGQEVQPWWIRDEKMKDIARRKFEELVESKSTNNS